MGGRRLSGDGVFVAPEDRNLGTVFQDYALFPHLDVAANVGFGLPRRQRAGRVDELLELVGLTGLGGRYPDQLSGGQRQRVAVARALAPSPDVVLLDEPWNAIDPLMRADMREEVAEILRAAGVTALIVTHDREEAFTLADRIAVMRDGEIAQVGRPEELYYQPADRWVAKFVGALNLVTGEQAECISLAVPVEAREVVIRPELVGLEPSEEAANQVVERTFLGHDVVYRVRLADGSTSDLPASLQRAGGAGRARARARARGPRPRSHLRSEPCAAL